MRMRRALAAVCVHELARATIAASPVLGASGDTHVGSPPPSAAHAEQTTQKPTRGETQRHAHRLPSAGTSAGALDLVRTAAYGSGSGSGSARHCDGLRAGAASAGALEATLASNLGASARHPSSRLELGVVGAAGRGHGGHTVARDGGSQASGAAQHLLAALVRAHLDRRTAILQVVGGRRGR